jgi:hypothetical protein
MRDFVFFKDEFIADVIVFVADAAEGRDCIDAAMPDCRL